MLPELHARLPLLLGYDEAIYIDLADPIEPGIGDYLLQPRFR